MTEVKIIVYVVAMRERRATERKELAQMQKIWALREPILDAHILSLQERIKALEGRMMRL